MIELLDSKPPVFTVGYQDDDGMTALHWAADRGNLATPLPSFKILNIILLHQVDCR